MSSIPAHVPAHVPVLADEALAALAVQSSGRYVDATFGRGGHAGRLLDLLGPDGRLLALDRDPDAVAVARERFADDARFSVHQANFAAVDAVVEAAGWAGQVNGLLADLGVSSPQLDVAERGFGFSRDGDLDMRMDPSSGESAAEWVARVDESELADVLKRFGEERYAKRIAKAIVAARAQQAILRTGELAEIVKAAHPRWERHHHPATRTFQAIRIAVNGELDALDSLLASAARILERGARLAVISFHSLEDRIVKRALRKPPPDPALPRGLPLPTGYPSTLHPWKVIGKAVRASAEELGVNPRARSAVLRVAERT
jgi:16S rRNA (cytosine1402-N4)-methyltransferase